MGASWRGQEVIGQVCPWRNRSVAGDLGPQRRAHVLRDGDDADPSEIQTVGVPTGADGGVIVMTGVGVPDAGVVEQLEMLIG